MAGRQVCKRMQGAAGTLFLALALALAPAVRPAVAQVQSLSGCLALAELKPVEAVAAARVWQSQGGGDPARQCLAQALYLSRDFPAAGRLFEELATGPGQSTRQRASLLGRAGWAWLRAGDTARADKLYSRALESLPEDADLRIDRALARAEAKRWKEVLEDLTLVIRQAPERADVVLLRASAYRHMGNAPLARADTDRALALRPGDAETLGLRGVLRAEAGDVAGARTDWEEAARRDPSGPFGRAAAANLQRLAPAKR